MDNEEKTFDPYHIIITLERSWAQDVALASSSNTRTCTDGFPSKLAVQTLMSEEIEEAIKTEAITGKLIRIDVEPPGFDTDVDKLHLSQQVLDAFRDILISTKMTDQELKDGTWVKLMEFLKSHPEMLRTRRFLAAGKYWELSPEQWSELQQYKGANQKIQAIKLVRMATNIGLKEAKDAVEDPRNNLFTLSP